MSFKINTSQLSSVLDPFYQKLHFAANSGTMDFIENSLKNDNSVSGVYLQFLQDLKFQPLSRDEIDAYMKQRFSGKKTKKNKTDTNNSVYLESDIIDINEPSNNATLDTQLEENAIHTTHVHNSAIRKQHLDKIVDYITHYPEQYPLAIDIGYHPENKISTSNSKNLQSLPGNLYTLDFSDLSSLYIYIASIYRYELESYIEPAEQSLLVSKVLDIDFTSATHIDTKQNIYNDKSDNIEWTLDDATVKNTWGNPQFVLEILNTHSNANKDYFISLFQLIDPVLFKNKDFLTQAFEYDNFFVALLDQKMIKPMEALELSLDQPHALKYLWKNYFSTPFENASINPEEAAKKYIEKTRYDRMREFNELSRQLHPHFNPYTKNQYDNPYMDDMIDYGDLTDEEIEQLEFEQEMYERALIAKNKKAKPPVPTVNDFERHEQQLYKEQLKSYTKKYNDGLSIKQFFIEHVFNDDVRLHYFLGNCDEITTAILKSIPKELKNSEHLFLTLLENAQQLKIENTYPGYDINDHLPKDFFDDPQTARDRKNAYLILSLDYLDHCSNLLSMPWFKNKDDILDTLNNFTVNNLHLISRHKLTSNFSPEQLQSLYSVISYRVDNDLDIMKYFIGHNKKYFEKLPEEYQNNIELISHYFSIGGSIHNISAKTLFSLPEKQLIINYIATNNNYVYLNHTDCPKELKTDPDMLCLLKSNIANIKFTDSEKKKVYSNIGLFTQVVSKEPTFYTTLPNHLKESLPITLSYLNNVKRGNHNNINASFIEKNLPAIVLSYDQVCLKALDVCSDFAPFIPLQHWNNRSFVRSVLKSIDNHDLSSSVLNSLPPSIKQCFSVYQVESNYLSFFNTFLLEQDMQKSLEHIAVSHKPVKKKKI